MNQGVDLVYRSTTRRKACKPCVKAKRRCDLSLPTCSRCTTKGLKCGYESLLDLRRQEEQIKQRTPIGNDGDKSYIIINGVATLPPMKVTTPQQDLLGSPFDPIRIPGSASISLERVSDCVSQLRLGIYTLVTEGRTMFIHPSMYEEKLPKTYQDLIGICSLCLNKTVANRFRLGRMLEMKAKELVAASKATVKVEDLLLNVQTLIMYLIIRIFDNDSDQPMNAEREFNVLSTWTNNLHEAYSEAEMCEAESETMKWILLEGIRRTLMVSIMLRCFYMNLTTGACEMVPLLAILPVSRNSSRWHQQQPGEEDESVVIYAEFVENWNKGKVVSVQDYELMLLRACRHARPVDGQGRILKEN